MTKTWELPDPFLKEDGRRISTREEWRVQREYFKKLLSEKMYGTMPLRPGYLTSEKTGEESFTGICEDGSESRGWKESWVIHTGLEGKIRIPITVFRPETSERVIPIIYSGGMGWFQEEKAAEALKEQFAVIVFEYEEGAPDSPEYGKGTCGQTYPEHTWRALAMWAWMQSRVIDWLETQDFADVDRAVVTGHSRHGKSTVCCGVFDERVAVCAPAGSGCGGMASMRHWGSRLGQGIGECETLGIMLNEKRFFYWLADEMRSYADPDSQKGYREDELPFDANILGALVAPRGLILTEGLDDTWINTFGTQVAWLGTTEVYEFLEAKEKCGLHYREGGHMYSMEDWLVMLDFCKVNLRGEKKKTNYKTVIENEAKCGYSWRCPKA